MKSKSTPASRSAATTCERVRALLEARPFRRFRLHLADGSSLVVLSAGHAGVLKVSRTVYVCTGKANEVAVSAAMISSIEVAPPGKR